MTIIVPNVGEVAIATRILDQALVLKLYSNDLVPGELDSLPSFIEVTGGGYVPINLEYANWVITPDGIAIYPAYNFQFTGPTTGPGTIFGYYVVNPAGIVLWAERFPTSAVPFIPITGSLIRITPRIQVA